MDPGMNRKTHWKINYLRKEINNRNSKTDMIPSIIAITETHLKPYIEDAQIQIPNYNCVRADRKLRSQGGVLLYFHQDIPITDYDTFDNDVCQAAACISSPSKSMLICAYRPPDTSITRFQQMLIFLQNYIDRNPNNEITILGDFNFPDICWTDKTINSPSKENSESEEIFLSFMTKHFLTQLVNKPTRKHNVLDLILSNSNNILQQVTSEENAELSDHNLVEIPLTPNNLLSLSNEETHKSAPTGFRALDLEKANFKKINQSLAAVDWVCLKASCTNEEFPSLFNETVLQICQNHCPPKTGSIKQKRKSQYGRNLHTLNRKKRKMRARLNTLKQLNPTSPFIPKLKKDIGRICLQLKEIVKSNLRSQEQKIVQKLRRNPKVFYSYVKKNSKTKSNINLLLNKEGQIITDSKTMADMFQEYFISVFTNPNSNSIHPPDFTPPPINFPMEDLNFSTTDIEEAIDSIQANSSSPEMEIPAKVFKKCKTVISLPIKLIWDESYDSENVPKHYKFQYITPIHKKDSTAHAYNYRPIAITSHIIKIFERILKKHIVQYLEDNNIINEKQHGFRKGKSCLTQLLAHYDNILYNAIQGNDTDIIYLDFAKAFDKIDHKILITKLSTYGFSGKLLVWIENFLTERSQCVTLNGKLSFVSPVISGVPQGSVLGPILFLLYINDLVDASHHSICRSFADDTRISKSISRYEDSILLQNDLNNVVNWSNTNNMVLNEDKFQLMIFSADKNNLMNNLPFMDEFKKYTTTSGICIQPHSVIKDLGINISNDFLWTTHINYIASKATKKAAWVLNTFSDREQFTMLTLYKSLIRSHIEYCCPLWNPQNIKEIQKLEAIQNSFVSKIHGLQSLNYWEKLEKLKLDSLQRRRERYGIIHMWKIKNNQAPNDLNFQFYENNRLGTKVQLNPILRPNSRYQTLRDNSFSHIGPRLWNLLPRKVSCQTSLKEFKLALFYFLDKYPDKPPLPGLTYINNNSLLSYPIFL